ncbi:hypothetical protein FOMG_18933 [Fusarium oxysporum f. sp. melonis 26406]|uniref:Carrier domain-containing protein n=1 Tax=Fusarium oxysporum f. sp. melonis 26406 TaxID=1089452 RepID=W9Z6T9_FUSOX|nr:hypothetical protein FOMG_18933 [Fusarium oxysporum f. sp. melonis 26406]
MAAQQQSLESILGINGQRKSLKQQLDAASIKTEAGRTTLADLPTVQIGCKKYIPEEYIANKNREGRRSWIQAHGFFLTEVSPDLRTLQTYWVCSKCDERGKSSLFVATNATSPIEHLRRSHMITEADDNADEDSYSSRADIHVPSKRRCLESPTARSNVNKAKELTVGWIVTANLPFTAPSNPYLRRMLDLHDALLAKEVPWSRQSVRDTMRKLFEVKKGVISSQLQKAVTRISFSFDLWTSPNRVREFFEHHYPREEQPETSRTVTGKAVRQDEPSQFDQWMQSCDRCMMEEEDELGVYMRQGPVRRENLNPVLWWKDHQEEYPRLSKFALDILAIPAMSVDPERTFSVTKLTRRCSVYETGYAIKRSQWVRWLALVGTWWVGREGRLNSFIGGSGQHLHFKYINSIQVNQRWASYGARNPILATSSVSRASESGDPLQQLSSYGCNARVEVCDVGDFAAVERLVAAIKTPVGGVIHSALRLSDRYFEDITLEDFDVVFGPKVNGSLNLIRAFSITTSTSLSCSVRVAETWVMRSNRPQLGMIDKATAEWQSWAKDAKLGLLRSRAADNAAIDPDPDSGESAVQTAVKAFRGTLGRLADVPEGKEAALQPVVCSAYVAKLAQVLSMKVGEIQPARSAVRYGVDSLIAIEARSWATYAFQIDLPINDLTNPYSIQDLAARVSRMIV